MPRKTYLDDLPPDNNMSAFYKTAAGAKYIPKLVKGNSFNKESRSTVDTKAKYKPGPGQYNTAGLEYKTTA